MICSAAACGFRDVLVFVSVNYHDVGKYNNGIIATGAETCVQVVDFGAGTVTEKQIVAYALLPLL